MPISADPDIRERSIIILDDAKDIIVATKRPDGYPQATVVSFMHDHEKVYFGCDRNGQKAENITLDDRMMIAYRKFKALSDPCT